MESRSTQLRVEDHGCDRAILDERASLEALLRRASDAAGESHRSIHPWPEHGDAAVELVLGGHSRPERAPAATGPGLASELGRGCAACASGPA